MKRDRAAKTLSLLRLIDPRTEQGQKFLRESLQDRSSLVVSRAARVVTKHALFELREPVVEAFQRYLRAKASADKGCEAKSDLAEALCELEASEEELFLQGSRLVQMEPAFGDPVDTAARLRGLCAIGLVRSGRQEVLNDLAELLNDPEPMTRSLAVRAVSETGERQGSALLRFLLLKGEEVPDVVLEAMSGLFHLSPHDAVDFLQRNFLRSESHPHWSLTVMALGESQSLESLELLLEIFSEVTLSQDRSMVIEALALTRLPKALDFLLDLLAEDHPQGEVAASAVEKFWGDSATLARLSEVRLKT